jgi:hypothetical protein
MAVRLTIAWRRLCVVFAITLFLLLGSVYRTYYLLNPIYPQRALCQTQRPRIRIRQLSACQFNNQVEEIFALHYGAHILGRALEYSPMRRQQLLTLNDRIPLTEFFQYTSDSCEVPFFGRRPEEEKERQYDVEHNYFAAENRLSHWQNHLQTRPSSGKPLYIEQRVFDWHYLPDPSFQPLIPDYISYLRHDLHLQFHPRITLPPLVAAEGDYIAVHFRRGDFREHCTLIADNHVPPVYMATYVMRNSTGWSSPTREQVLSACWPTTTQLSLQILRVARDHGLNSVYIMHNAGSDEIADLRQMLGHQNGMVVHDSSELRIPAREQVEMSIATDLLVGTRAKVFMGNRWSSVGSNIALIRHVEQREKGTLFY